MGTVLNDKEYSDNGKTIVNCNKCGVALFTFWNVKNTNNYTKVRVDCPLCGWKSDIIDFFGVNYIACGNDGISNEFSSYEVEQIDDDKMKIILEKK